MTFERTIPLKDTLEVLLKKKQVPARKHHEDTDADCGGSGAAVERGGGVGSGGVRQHPARKTTDEVVLTFREKTRLEEFPSDLGKHPVSRK